MLILPKKIDILQHKNLVSHMKIGKEILHQILVCFGEENYKCIIGYFMMTIKLSHCI